MAKRITKERLEELIDLWRDRPSGSYFGDINSVLKELLAYRESGALEALQAAYHAMTNNDPFDEDVWVSAVNQVLAAKNQLEAISE